MHFELTPMTIALYGVAGAGLVLGGLRGLAAFKSMIHIEAFCAQVTKLVAAGNIERALKLCSVVPQAAFVKIIRPALEAVSDESEDGRVRASRFEKSFESNYESYLASNRLGPLLSLAAVFLGALPPLIAFAYSGRPALPLIVIGLVAAAGGGHAFNVGRKLRAAARPAVAPVAAALRKG